MQSHFSPTQAGTEGEFPHRRFQAYLHSQHSAWETSHSLGIIPGHSTIASVDFSWPIRHFWQIETCTPANQSGFQPCTHSHTLGKPFKLPQVNSDSGLLQGQCFEWCFLLFQLSRPKKGSIVSPTKLVLQMEELPTTEREIYSGSSILISSDWCKKSTGSKNRTKHGEMSPIATHSSTARS